MSATSPIPADPRFNTSRIADYVIATPPTNDSSFDLTAASILAPDDVFEDSITDPDPQPVQDLPEQPEWTVQPKGSKRGKPLLVDDCGFSYTIQKTLSYAVFWWCSVRPKEGRCRATVLQRGERFIRGAADHNHPSTTGLLTKATIDMKVGEVAKSGDYYKSSGVMAEDFFQVESEANRPCTALAPLSQAARKIHYHRQGDRPSDPKDLEFEIASCFIPDEFLLIFAIQHQLDTLSTAKTWYVDSTFRVVSSPFYQLLSIHAFLVSGTTMKQVPLLFTLMSRRQTEDYMAVFSAVRDMLPSTTIERMVTDFEAVTWKGFQVYPAVQIKGCTFHMNQAIYRKVRNLNLTTAFDQDLGTHRFVKRIMALQFLDAAQIRAAFGKVSHQGPPPSWLPCATTSSRNGFLAPSGPFPTGVCLAPASEPITILRAGIVVGGMSRFTDFSHSSSRKLN